MTSDFNNIQPHKQELPENLLLQQKQLLLAIPAKENRRRKTLRATFFSTCAAACVAIAAFLTPGLSLSGNADDNLDYIYSQLSESSLQHTIDIADSDPFLSLE